MSSVSSHPIYAFFKERTIQQGDNVIKKYKCAIKDCQSSIKWTGSPTNLIKHLKTHTKEHNEYESKINKRKIDEMDSCSSPVAKRQELSYNNSIN